MTRVCIDKGTDPACCKNWLNGIRTINGQYPDDNREFKINAGDGIVITPSTAGIEITNEAPSPGFIQGDNIELTPSGDDLIIAMAKNVSRIGTTDLSGTVNITGDITVTGNITQNGSAYESHAEQLFTRNDYIYMRDGATGALGAGSFSGFQVKKYDGVNDGRLVIDKDGVARVGDVGDEQPLLTRDESDQLPDGAILKWDSTAQKAYANETEHCAMVTSPTIQRNPVAFTANTYADYSTDYPYMCTMSWYDILYGTGMDVSEFDGTHGEMAIVNFLPQMPQDRAVFAPWCESDSNGVTVFASEMPTDMTIMKITYIGSVTQ